MSEAETEPHRYRYILGVYFHSDYFHLTHPIKPNNNQNSSSTDLNANKRYPISQFHHYAASHRLELDDTEERARKSEVAVPL